MTDFETDESTSSYHWTRPAQRRFLEALAETGSVELAAQAAGKSRRAAYNLRRSPAGVAFRAGWAAAVLLARDVVTDTLIERALFGQRSEIERDSDGRVSARTRFDPRLSMALLTRLDTMAEGHEASRRIADDFGRFCDLVEIGGDADAVEEFLRVRIDDEKRRQTCELVENSADSVDEGDVDDGADDDGELDIESRLAALRVWYCDWENTWKTNFPPVDWEDDEGSFDDPNYERELTPGELAVLLDRQAKELEPLIDAAAAARDDYFYPSPADGEDADMDDCAA